MPPIQAFATGIKVFDWQLVLHSFGVSAHIPDFPNEWILLLVVASKLIRIQVIIFKFLCGYCTTGLRNNTLYILDYNECCECWFDYVCVISVQFWILQYYRDTIQLGISITTFIGFQNKKLMSMLSIAVVQNSWRHEDYFWSELTKFNVCYTSSALIHLNSCAVSSMQLSSVSVLI